MNIKARFGTTVCSLVAQGLGIAIIDEFTVAHGQVPGLRTLDIDAESTFHTYVAYRSDVSLSAFAEQFLRLLRAEMTAATSLGGQRSPLPKP
jgi:DNA-binding transcriptional LysR family regulator